MVMERVTGLICRSDGDARASRAWLAQLLPRCNRYEPVPGPPGSVTTPPG